MENAGFIAILLSILLWAMFVLLPMWPAIKIYKLFPDTKVGISGPLQGLDVKASGAFAAYVVTALLGFILVQNTQELIEDYKDSEKGWSVTSTIQFLDANGDPIDDSGLQSLIEALEITILPDKNVKSGKHVKLLLPEYDEDIVLLFSVEGYRPYSKELSEAERVDSKKLNLGVIELWKLVDDYDQDGYLSENDALSANEEAASSQDEQEVMLASQQ